MSINFLHLLPAQLGQNGETGNLTCLTQRLSWAGHKSSVQIFDGSSPVPTNIDAVFIGSGTLAGALEALGKLRDQASALRELALSGVPFFAIGLGWEILGQSIKLLDGETVAGAGVFPSRSTRVNRQASVECYGYDSNGTLTTGYANHSSEIEIFSEANPLIQLAVGFGNSSLLSAKQRPDEGLISGNLMAARLNGPILPLNPHIADQFLSLVAAKSGISYRQESNEARACDEFAAMARTELSKRLAR